MPWGSSLFPLLIVTSSGKFTGLFVYSPGPGSGNLVASSTAQAGTDPFGNAYLAGETSYGPGGDGVVASQLGAGGLNTWTATTMAGPWRSKGSITLNKLVAGGNNLYVTDVQVDAATGAFGIGNPPNATIYLAPSGDPSGADDTARLNAALGFVGTVVLMPGTYYVNSTINLGIGQYVIGSGMAGTNGTIVNFVGAGDCFRQTFAGTYSGLTTVGGGIQNLTIDGSGHTAGASAGIHAGDIESLNYDQTFVRNFTGAGDIGYHFDNVHNFTERLEGTIRVAACTSGVVFDVNGGTVSFARCDLDIFITQGSNQWTGVELRNAARVYDIVGLAISGNMTAAAPATTAALLKLAANCTIQNGPFSIGVELGAGANAPQTINFGASAIITGTIGVWDFGTGTAFAQSNNAGNVQHTGQILGDSTLTSSEYFGTSAQAPASSGTIFTSFGRNIVLNPGGALTGMIMQAGFHDGINCRVINRSANTITMAVAATSNVANGASCVIPALEAIDFVWVAAAALWYQET